MGELKNPTNRSASSIFSCQRWPRNFPAYCATERTTTGGAMFLDLWVFHKAHFLLEKGRPGFHQSQHSAPTHISSRLQWSWTVAAFWPIALWSEALLYNTASAKQVQLFGRMSGTNSLAERQSRSGHLRWLKLEYPYQATSSYSRVQIYRWS